MKTTALGRAGLLACACAAPSFAQDAKIDTGDNAWLLVSSALVLMMTAPGLAFDRKDTIQDQWMSLAFGETVPISAHLVPSYEGYIACCLNGAGWGLVPGNAGWGHVRRGELIELVPGRSVKVALHWQASTQSSEILRRLGEVVFEEACENLLPDRYRAA